MVRKIIFTLILLLLTGQSGFSKGQERDPGDLMVLAAKNGDQVQVEQFLSLGIDVNIKDRKGQTPLFASSADGNLKMVHLLLKKGAKPRLKNKNGDFPLAAAVLNKHMQVADVLIQFGANLEELSPSGSPLLMESFRDEDPKLALDLIQRGANVNAKDKNGMPALNLAVRLQRLKVVNALLKAGADANSVSPNGKPALSEAISKNCAPDMVKVLLTFKADVNLRPEPQNPMDVMRKEKFQYSPLKSAVFANCTGISKLLMQAGATVRKGDPQSDEILSKAVSQANHELVALLMGPDADPNAMTKGQTLLMTACRQKDLKMANLLVEKGADTDIQNANKKETALMISSQLGYAKIVQFLLKEGANPFIKNDFGHDAASLARKAGHIEISNKITQFSKGVDVPQTPEKFSFKVDDLSAEECDAQDPTQRENCYYYFGAKLRDRNQCNRLTTFTDKRECIEGSRLHQQAPRDCNVLATHDKRNRCLNAFAFVLGNGSACGYFDETSVRNDCYAIVAKDFSQSYLCKKISVKLAKENCFKGAEGIAGVNGS